MGVAEGIGIPVLFSPNGAKWVALLTKEDMRLFLEISTGGNGVPNGGATGEFLVKRTGTDGDVQWSGVIDGGNF